MTADLQATVDATLRQAVADGIPGLCATVTDRHGAVFEGMAGARQLGGSDAMTLDTVFAIFSATKAVTGTLCLQLWEEGVLDLDAPAQDYVPELADCQVIDGFDAGGLPRLRAPKRPITTRMLLLHTAGFGYDFFNATYHRLGREHGQPSVTTATRAALRTPLLFDPGEGWEYGSSIDWAGQVVERILGQRLGTAMQARLFAPLGMVDTSFALTPAMRARRAVLHRRDMAGGWVAEPEFALPPRPEVQMGGHGLYSTVRDFGQFVRMWMNDGMGPQGRMLRSDTVAMAAQNGLGDRKIRGLPGVRAELSNFAEFFPGQTKSWGLTFMINDEVAPTGRPAGALGWAGFANFYYWIDRQNGIGGVWASQLLPFMDPAALAGYLNFETAVYRAFAAQHTGQRAVS